MKICNTCKVCKPADDFYAKRAKCKDCCNKIKAAYCQANNEKHAVIMKVHYQANKEQYAKNYAAYCAANKDKLAARTAKRKAIKLNATPQWADSKRIQAYYDVAAFFNEVNGYIKYHVDHIIPLQGKNVSGLHVHNNMRVIKASENLEKSNKFEI